MNVGATTCSCGEPVAPTDTVLHEGPLVVACQACDWTGKVLTMQATRDHRTGGSK